MNNLESSMGIYIFRVCLIHIYKEVWEFVETEKKKKYRWIIFGTIPNAFKEKKKK